MKTIILHILLLTLLFAPSQVKGQAAPDTTIDLSLLATGEMWAVFNRTVTLVEEGEKRGVYLDEKPGQGVAWLPSFRTLASVVLHAPRRWST